VHEGETKTKRYRNVKEESENKWIQDDHDDNACDDDDERR